MSTNNNETAKKRDEIILRLAETHVINDEVLVALGLFRTTKRARERLLKLESRRKLRWVGYAKAKTGRLRKAYARWKTSHYKVDHELELTWCLIRLKAEKVVRGWYVDDFNCDAEVWIDGHKFYWEHDRGTERYEQVAGRMKKLMTCEDTILWVCPDEQRLERLKHTAKTLGHEIFFGLYSEVSRDPHAENIWISSDNDERMTL